MTNLRHDLEVGHDGAGSALQQRLTHQALLAVPQEIHHIAAVHIRATHDNGQG
jgi:hypothetical protein